MTVLSSVLYNTAVYHDNTTNIHRRFMRSLSNPLQWRFDVGAWACVRASFPATCGRVFVTRDRLKNRSGGVFSSSRLKEQVEFVALKVEETSCGSGGQVRRGGFKWLLWPTDPLFSIWILQTAQSCFFFYSSDNTGWCGGLWWDLVSHFGGRLSRDRHTRL